MKKKSGFHGVSCDNVPFLVCVCVFCFFNNQPQRNAEVTTNDAMSGRDIEPLLLSKLCDRGTAIQPTSSIVTRRFFAESRFLERDGNGYVFYAVVKRGF